MESLDHNLVHAPQEKPEVRVSLEERMAKVDRSLDIVRLEIDKKRELLKDAQGDLDVVEDELFYLSKGIFKPAFIILTRGLGKAREALTSAKAALVKVEASEEQLIHERKQLELAFYRSKGDEVTRYVKSLSASKPTIQSSDLELHSPDVPLDFDLEKLREREAA